MSAVLLTAIPYTTFPSIELGPLTLRTFGLMLALGAVTGCWLAARYGEQHGIPREATYSLTTRMVIAGVIGSRITWVATHLDELESPLEAFAIWRGGLQFSGGFVFAIIAGYPVYRHWNRLTRWHSLDGFCWGLCVGMGVGRIGCYGVGEHFGSETSFPLAVRYEGGEVRENLLGSVPLIEGAVFHHTALYELIYMAVLFAILTYVLRRPSLGPGASVAIFCGFYGVARFASDALRVNDERLLGLTGAQFMCVVLVPVSIWIWFRVRRQLRGDVAAGMPVGLQPAVSSPTEVDVSGA